MQVLGRQSACTLLKDSCTSAAERRPSPNVQMKGAPPSGYTSTVQAPCLHKLNLQVLCSLDSVPSTQEDVAGLAAHAETDRMPNVGDSMTTDYQCISARSDIDFKLINGMPRLDC